MSHHAERCKSSEQTLNQLLSVQRAVLERRDEILNGVLHTFLLLGSLHTATITADAQRCASAAPKSGSAADAVRRRLQYQPRIANINALRRRAPPRGLRPRDITAQSRTPATPAADGT